MLQKKDLRLPEKPGIYLFRSRAGKILYIGKARNLRSRVSHYFLNRGSATVRRLLESSGNVDFIVTKDENDALRLEYNFIQNYLPPFNIRLKDDKTYPAIEVTLAHKFPGIYYSRSPGKKSFATSPLTQPAKAREMIDLICRIFKIRTCREAEFSRGVPCLYYHIDRCSGPCFRPDQLEDYAARVRDAVSVLKGHRSKVTAKLKKMMLQKSAELNYEAALQLKQDIDLIAGISLASMVSGRIGSSYDVIDIYCDSDGAAVMLFSVVAGKISAREFYTFPSPARDRNSALCSFLISHYNALNLPGELLLPVELPDRAALEDLFSGLTKRRVCLKVPLRGARKQMLNMLSRNLNLYVSRNRYTELALRLQQALNLSVVPERIECIDISHFAERERVGAVVVFVRGEAERRHYRNYIIRRALPGDTEAIKEVLLRRLKNKNLPKPDLLVIDGGAGQLTAAREVKELLKLEIDLVALAKREERIFLEYGGSVVFPEDSPERFLMQNIRDETHRRAVTFHKKRRQKI